MRTPNCFLTADSALVVGKEVLLVRRKHDPFQGNWCFPGGFVDPEEKVEEGALRELMEETGITGIKMQQFKTYADPGRDPRGRTVTVVFWARLQSKPQATAGDDAAEAGWYPMEDLPPMAFDHGKIVNELRKFLEKK